MKTLCCDACVCMHAHFYRSLYLVHIILLCHVSIDDWDQIPKLFSILVMCRSFSKPINKFSIIARYLNFYEFLWSNFYEVKPSGHESSSLLRLVGECCEPSLTGFRCGVGRSLWRTLLEFIRHFMATNNTGVATNFMRLNISYIWFELV